MQWRFTLIDRNDVPTKVKEPEGWADFALKLKRHPQRHGTFREIQGNNFRFAGSAGKMIREEYLAYGAQGNLTLTIEGMTKTGFVEFYKGALSFSAYKASYDKGDYGIEIDTDQIGPLVDLINRWEQSVDLTATKCFDGVTPLAPYNFINFPITMPSKAILLRDVALNNEQHELKIEEDSGWFIQTPNRTGTVNGSIPVTFDNVTNNELDTFNAGSVLDFFNHSAADEETPPIYINQRSAAGKKVGLNCLTSVFNVQYRVKGRFKHAFTSNSGTISLRLEMKRGFKDFNDPGDFLGNGFLVYNGPITGFTKEFDFTYGSTFTLQKNQKLWLTFFLVYTRTSFGGEVPIRLQLDAETFYKAESISKCDPTFCQVFMLNESMSRLIETTTNNQLRLYSEYLGRPDSEPYSFPSHGCGANRILTNGKAIRRIIYANDPAGPVTKSPNVGVFSSMKDCFEALAATDNIGMGIEGDLVRIEPWTWFYKNDVIFTAKNLPKIERAIVPSEIYSTFKFGYEKWEAEDSNGLDDFFTKREYRLDLPNIKNTLEQVSKFIASGYAIEITRRKGADSSDWRYDNDMFMICVEPDGTSYKVEIGNITDASNIIDPVTIYNFRISPVRNALRWFNRVIGSYRNVNSGHKIIFASGEANYEAAGQLTALDCTLEAGVLAENQDLNLTVFTDQASAIPIMWPERVKFTCPVGTTQYQSITANPYGLVEFSSPTDKGFGWIDELTYRPNEGMADFTLIPKIA